MGDGKFEKTIYTGCFSARTGNYYYAMYGDPSIRYVSLMDAEGASPDRLVVPEPRRS
ncbi:MAG: linear amide C-N hydrolase [Collinsella sp.]|jgi:choloylglycine hydrolase